MTYWTSTKNTCTSCIWFVNSNMPPQRRHLLCTENPQLGWGFRKAFSFEPVIKTPFDLLKHLAVWQLQVSNKKSKGGPNGERKELSAHPMEL